MEFGYKNFGGLLFKQMFHFDGELGCKYDDGSTSFMLWAPTAKSVKLCLYNTGDYEVEKKPKSVLNMFKIDKGVWRYESQSDLRGKYYTYLITIKDKTNEVIDPYAKGVGVNGVRGMIIDLKATNPEGWENDVKPQLNNPIDSIIYEMHVRDFSIHKSSGVSDSAKGKFNGIWEDGTVLFGEKKDGQEIKTGISHLKELGITHLHLLPVFDYLSVDENQPNKPQYNWGYDPQNYNAPEGSYSTDPHKGEVRIKEFKKMVLELHKAGIRVVMDMVYNHTGKTNDSNFNLTVPDYYYRQDDKGIFTNGSGCGNELASERSMVRKFIVDSVIYWAKEYHIDGFRFDLMGLHDIETIKKIRESLDEIDKSIIIYGEGWTGGNSALPDIARATKYNAPKFSGMQVAFFSDDIRDGIKGQVFDRKMPGFVNGFSGLEELIKFGVVGSVNHYKIRYGTNPQPYNGHSSWPWANEPYQTITYASAHDNLTLWDKLQETSGKRNEKSNEKGNEKGNEKENEKELKEIEEKLKAMNKMSAVIVLTSQGIPFFQGGEEFLRTKKRPDGTFEENSYNQPDSINEINWERKKIYFDIFKYYQGLIELRKSHRAFRLNSNSLIQEGINFLEFGVNFNEKNVVAYIIDGKIVEDYWNSIVVIFNANDKDVEVILPLPDWVIVVNGETAGIKQLGIVDGKKVIVPKYSSYVLVDKNSFLANS